MSLFGLLVRAVPCLRRLPAALALVIEFMRHDATLVGVCGMGTPSHLDAEVVDELRLDRRAAIMVTAARAGTWERTVCPTKPT